MSSSIEPWRGTQNPWMEPLLLLLLLVVVVVVVVVAVCLYLF
jgi:hypothetical protein